MKKKVLVLNEGEPTKEFRPAKGEYRKQLKDFETQGYEIIQKNIKDPETEIPSILAAVEDESLAFVWPRMHGTPKSMTAAMGKDITSENLPKIFALLPKKLTSDAIIFLESCKTGNLTKDFYDNIQFTFAKLTLELPDVQIIAPSELLAMYRFSFNEGIFRCNMASNSSRSQDISITIGAKTKQAFEIIRIINDKTSLDVSTAAIGAKTKELIKLIKIIGEFHGGDCEEVVMKYLMESLLLDSVIKNKEYYAPSAYYSINQVVVLDSQYDTSKMLQAFIKKIDFQSVNTLVEKYVVPVNSEDSSVGYWQEQTPLAYAFYQIKCASSQKDQESLINIAKYLISKGADLLLGLSDVRPDSQQITNLLYKFAINDNMPREILEACAEVLLHQKNRLDSVVVLDQNGTALNIIKEYLFGDFFGEVEQYGITQQMATLPSELVGQESDDDTPLVWGL